VVAADEVHAVGVAEFEADEEGDGFDAEEAAVDVVAWRYVRGVMDTIEGGPQYQGTSYQGKDNLCPGMDLRF
jgi:hypothetical protein